MGFIDDILEYCDFSLPKRKKRKTLQTVEIKVKMDCGGCERRIRNAVSGMKGAKSVEVDRKQSKVTVEGFVEESKVLKRVRSTGKRAELWPYVPYDLVYYPYAKQAYDKKAPPGYVKDVPQAMATPNGQEETYTWMFSDENPQSCSIM